MINRRAFLFGATAALAAPAVVRAESLMRIAVLRESLNEDGLLRVLDRLMLEQNMYEQRVLYFVNTVAKPMLVSWSAAQDHTNWSVT